MPDQQPAPITDSSFPTARAAGLPMLGGRDIFITLRKNRVRGHFWPGQNPDRLPIVLSPGFTEFCEKYSAVAKRLHQLGHDVLIIDWPGQGRSGKLARDEYGIYINSFATHLRAMDMLMDEAGLGDRKRIFMGHSMGGHLTLRLAQRHAAVAAAAIALSPMICPPILPVLGVRVLARFLVMLGLARRRAPLTYHRHFDEERVFHPDNRLTRDEEGYTKQFLWFDDAPEIWRSGASIGWVRAAYASCAKTTLNPRWMRRLTLPVLALTAGDERVVNMPSTDRMLPFLPDCTHHKYAGAQHELLFETDDVKTDVWTRIEAFLKAHG